VSTTRRAPSNARVSTLVRPLSREDDKSAWVEARVIGLLGQIKRRPTKSALAKIRRILGEEYERFIRHDAPKAKTYGTRLSERAYVLMPR
jgi:hypothetical protein